MIRPWLGNHHHDGMRQGTSRQDQKFQTVVEHGRIAAIRADDGHDLRQILPEELRLQHGLPGMHPVDVAPQGVDFPVMRAITIGMRTRPTGERVGAEARMHQRQTRFHGGIHQLGIVFLQLLRHEHPLVHQRPVREAWNVEILAPLDAAITNGVLHPAADHVEFPLKGQVILKGGVATDKHLPHRRFAPQCRFTQGAVVRGYPPPPQHFLALFLDDLFKYVAALLQLAGVHRHEHKSRAVLTKGRQGKTDLCTSHLEEAVRHLHQNARSIPCVAFASTGPAMAKIGENIQGLSDNIVGFSSSDVHHETHSAGFMFKLGIVETLLTRSSELATLFRFHRMRVTHH